MRVVIGEDSLLLREGIARVLEASGIEVVGLAGDYDELIAAVDRGAARTSPSSTSACRPPTPTRACAPPSRSARSCPQTGVLVLSQYLDEDYVFALLGDGAERLGYLLKDRITDGDAFVDAVRRVAAGDAALDPEVVAHLLGRSNGGGPLDDLTERERTVLAEMAEGRSNRRSRPACSSPTAPSSATSPRSSPSSA